MCDPLKLALPVCQAWPWQREILHVYAVADKELLPERVKPTISGGEGGVPGINIGVPRDGVPPILYVCVDVRKRFHDGE